MVDKLVRMVDNPVYQDGRQTCQDGYIVYTFAWYRFSSRECHAQYENSVSPSVIR